MRAEINTGKDRFAAFENRYRIDVIKKKINRKIDFFFAQPYSLCCDALGNQIENCPGIHLSLSSCSADLRTTFSIILPIKGRFEIGL